MAYRSFSILDTSPATAQTAIGTVLAGLGEYDFIRVDALLVGATGGTLDVYLQRHIGPDAWADWIHFPQLAAGAAAIRQSVLVAPALNNTILQPNLGTDVAPTVGLAANNYVGGHPGNQVRAVYVAGASTSLGAAVKLYIGAWGSRR